MSAAAARPRARLSSLCAALAVALAASFAVGCAVPHAQTDAAIDKLRRSAVRLSAPEEVVVQAGHGGTVNLTLRVKRGFYLPAKAEADPGLQSMWLEAPKRSYAMIGPIAFPAGELVDLPTRRNPVHLVSGESNIGVALRVHRNTSALTQRLYFVLHYQVCTVRGCDVPERQGVHVTLRVLPADKSASDADLM